MLKVLTPIVSVDWLNENLNNPNLIVIDATMKKVSVKENEHATESVKIKNARFLDVKNTFSETMALFPNMLLSPLKFEEKAREIGVNNESAIVVYDRYGYYSSARVWWMYKAMGFNNIAVLDGGLPSWIDAEFPTQNEYELNFESGNFNADYNSGLIHDHEKVLNSINDGCTTILDARSYNRFLGTDPEPRKGLRSGHIPTSKSLPYTKILNGTQMKQADELKKIFSVYKSKNLIFSCGSGITACILALGAEIAGIKNKSVYDGSWTEWGSLLELPIEK